MPATVVWDKARSKWMLLNRMPDGTRRKLTLGPLEADRERGQKSADELNRRSQRARYAKGRLGSGGVVLGRDALDAWWAAARPGFADSTRRTVEGWLRLHLHPFFDELDLATLNRERIKAFAGDRADAGLGQHAIQGCLSVLRRTMRWCVEEGALQKLPLEQIVKVGMLAAASRGARKGSREPFTHAEAARVMELADDHLRPVILCALHTGARKGELLALTWDCVNFDRGEIEWRASRWHTRTKPTKANRVRRSTMSEEVQSTLRTLSRERFAQPAQHVFLDRSGKPWVYDSLNTAWKRLQKRAHAKHGVRPLPFHSWRHTYVSWALSSGADPLWVAAQIGDRVETMYRTYSHVMQGKAQSLEFLKLVEPVDKPPHRVGR